MNTGSVNQHDKEGTPPGLSDFYMLLHALKIGAIDFKQFLEQGRELAQEVLQKKTTP